MRLKSKLNRMRLHKLLSNRLMDPVERPAFVVRHSICSEGCVHLTGDCGGWARGGDGARDGIVGAMVHRLLPSGYFSKTLAGLMADQRVLSELISSNEPTVVRFKIDLTVLLEYF